MWVILLLGVLLLLAGCGDSQTSSEPRRFTTDIDNPYWPMPPGARWVYREGSEKVVVTVTDRTRTVASGVEARVVHDIVTDDGEVIEDTHDWYAQDQDGNVWYLGEDTKEYEHGKVKTNEGSWEAGVDGAQPGIIVHADPRPGPPYRQEYYEGHAEDMGQILSVDEQVQVPAGHYTGAVLTKDYTPLEPEVLEYKLYAKGVGPVMTLNVSGGSGREELLRHTR